MSEPTTEAGRAASKAIKSGMLGMWADDPDDPIGSVVASVEAEARATLLAELRAKVEAIDHPCHDVCVGNLHADCQCAAWVRQEAIRAVLGAEKP